MMGWIRRHRHYACDACGDAVTVTPRIRRSVRDCYVFFNFDVFGAKPIDK